MAGWKWKAGDGSSSGLLYEPGNWGDILKNEWLLRTLDFLRNRPDSPAEPNPLSQITLLDPFAGQPDYPLAAGARRRMDALPDLKLHAAAQPFFAQSRWPGACALALQYGVFRVDVLDADPNRRAALAGQSECDDDGQNSSGGLRLLQDDCGWQALAQAKPEEYSLILVDPYDILQEWRDRLEMILSAATHTPLLLYIYNRSGRGKERLRDYRAFCAQVSRSGLGICLARVEADAFLPECWHEMLLLAPGGRENYPGANDLAETLKDSALRIRRTIAEAAVFEEF